MTGGKTIYVISAALAVAAAAMIAVAALLSVGGAKTAPAQADATPEKNGPAAGSSMPKLHGTDDGGSAQRAEPTPQLTDAPATAGPSREKSEDSPLLRRFEKMLESGDQGLHVIRMGLIARDERVIDMVLANPDFARSLGPQLPSIFPGKSGLDLRIRALLDPSSPRDAAEMAKLGDPGAMESLIAGENRLTPLLDSMLGGRPKSVEEAKSLITRIRSRGFDEFAAEKGHEMLLEKPPAPGDSRHQAYHAFFNRMACIGHAGPQEIEVLEKYVSLHEGDAHFACAVEGRLNASAVLAAAGSIRGLSNLVDLISQPCVSASPKRGAVGELAWVEADRQYFISRALAAERFALCVTDFRATLGPYVDYDPVSRRFLFDKAETEKARADWRKWWLSARDRLVFDAAAGRFVDGVSGRDRANLWRNGDAVFETLKARESELAR